MTRITLRRILAPVDFSSRSLESARYAHRLARVFHSELVLLHVLEPVGIDFSMIEPSRKRLQELMDRHIVELESRLQHIFPPGSDVRTNCTVQHGDPADQIVKCAKDLDADLIVMPTQGRGRVREFLIGSVTAKVLHDSTVPVLTGVHLKEIDFPDSGVHRILSAIDFGVQSSAVLSWAGSLAELFGAQLTALHVVERRALLSGNGDSDAHESELSRLKEQVSAALNSNAGSVETLVESGDPHKVIAAAAGRLSADVLIIGRGSAHTVVGRLRAQAYGIVRLSPCPVLSV